MKPVLCFACTKISRLLVRQAAWEVKLIIRQRVRNAQHSCLYSEGDVRQAEKMVSVTKKIREI